MKTPIGITALAAAIALMTPAQAQEGYPSDTVRIIIPVPAGGGTDILGRIVAQPLSERLGRPVVIESRPGGGMTIGTHAVVQAKPDGHTFLLIDTALTVNPFLYSNLPYDTVEDLAPVSLLATAPVIMVVHPSTEANDVEELIALAKERPGELTFASGGNGAATHLAVELFMLETGTDLIHIPYPGTGPAVTDLVGGHVNLMIGGISSARQHVEAGALVALAVSGEERNEAMPDVPTFAEHGLDVDAMSYWGLLAPAGTPDEIIERVSGELQEIMQLPQIVEQVKELGYITLGTTPSEYADNIESEMAKWGPVVEQAGVQVD